MRRVMIVFTVVVALVCFAPDNSAAADSQFRISDFTVVVDEFQINAGRIGPPVAKVTFNFPKTLDGLTISGKGHTAINGRRVNVAFYKIRLKYDGALVLPGRGLPVRILPLVAIKGVVKGTAFNPSYVAYHIGSYRIFVKPDTLSISPKQAEAIVSVGINTQHFTDTFSQMTIHSPVSFISSTGAVAASNFSNSVRFDLKGSPLQLVIRPEDKYNVNLGGHFPISVHGRQGISIKGRVSKDNVDAFRLTGVISNTHTVVLAATLEQSFHTYPDNYTIHVQRGRIDLSYKANGERSVGGRFGADIQIPDANRNENNQLLASLTDVDLDLDNQFGLNNSIEIKEKVRIGRHFVFEPAPDGAWAYFPNWPINQSYASYKTKPRNCNQWRDAFSDLLQDGDAGRDMPIHALAKRPGITLVKGVTYFTSPQIRTTDDDLKTTIKSRADAMLTLTFAGPTGPLAGAGASFVSVDSDIAKGDSIATPARKQWQEIIAAGENLPEEQGHRFTLADLRILDMKLVTAYFCGNQMEPQSAMFHYSVHFPHPCYINLLFEDKTLGPDGRFSMAKGPVVPVTINFSVDISDAEMANLGSELPKYSYFLPNPDTHILWAWRLPISFSDRGVHITFNAANDTDTDIAVRMFTASSPEPEATLTGAQHAAMVDSGEPAGRITSSEMWLKPLYSRDSAIRKGVRFGAAMNALNGAFEVTDIDTAPFLSPIYAAPGDERNVGFYTKLNRLADGGLKLADTASNPVDRHADFFWSGKIQFPFFSDADPVSWKSVRFDVKDLLADMDGALSMSHEGMKYACQNQSSGVCYLSTQPPSLFVEVEDLRFRPQQTDFFSTKVNAIERDGDQTNTLKPRSLLSTSFINTFVQLDYPVVAEPYIVASEYAPGGECGAAKWTRSILTDYQRSINQVDLVCHDREAVCIRGCETCSEAYITGTYEVRARSCASLDECNETTVFKAPKAKYYPNLKRIDLSRSDAIASTDAGDNPYQTVINIPSAQIAFSEDGRYIEGAFGATYAQVAVNLPYEGFFIFKLDNKCGYYYLYGGGSFTYALTFRGQSIVFNAPYRFLKQPSPFFMVTDTMRALTIRALYSSEDRFEKAAGLDDVQMDTVLSGLITSANVEFGYTCMGIGLTVKAGPGLVLYQYKNPGEEKKYHVGAFLKAIGEAELNLLLMSIGANGDAELSMTADVPQTVMTLEDLNAIRERGEFSLYGSLALEGCGSITCIGSCCGKVTLKATFSNDDGLNAAGADWDAGCEGESCLW